MQSKYPRWCRVLSILRWNKKETNFGHWHMPSAYATQPKNPAVLRWGGVVIHPIPSVLRI